MTASAELLRKYHANPGQTVAMYEPWRTAEGLTSYEVAASEVDSYSRNDRILDLACGDGRLLELLAERDFTNLVGVDLSPEELAAAQIRLGDRAQLHCRPADALGLADQSVDAVVCHLALMLMQPVEPVLEEIARVLRRGAKFVAVVNRYVEHPVYEAYRRAVFRMTKDSGLERLRLGDARVFTGEGFGELLTGTKFARDTLQVRDFDFTVRTTPAALWSMLRPSYDVYRLPELLQTILEKQVLEAWCPWVDDEGTLTCSTGMRLLACRVH